MTGHGSHSHDPKEPKRVSGSHGIANVGHKMKKNKMTILPFGPSYLDRLARSKPSTKHATKKKEKESRWVIY